MTHNTRVVALNALKYPAFVEYGGRIYRAWKRAPVAGVGGDALIATNTDGHQVVLLYVNPKPQVLLVVG